MKKKVVFVGAFNKNSSNVGGQLFACTSLVESELSNSIEWFLIDTTAETNQFRSVWNRSYHAGARLFSFIKAIRSFRPDTVMIFFAHRGSFLEKGIMGLIAKLAGSKVVLCGRSGLLITDIAESKIWRTFAKFVFRFTDVVVCQSEGWKKFYIQHVGSTGRVKYEVIPNWIRMTDYALNAASQKEKLSTDIVTILFLGWVTRDKGIFELLEAFNKLDRTRARLIVAGDGEDLIAARQHAEKLGISNAIHFTGWVRGEEKHELLKQADVFVLPSYYEGLPNSLLEAMASRIAVVATAVGGIPDLITHSINGLLVPVRAVDELTEMLQILILSEDKRNSFATAGYNHVSNNHSLEAAVDSFNKIL